MRAKLKFVSINAAVLLGLLLITNLMFGLALDFRYDWYRLSRDNDPRVDLPNYPDKAKAKIIFQESQIMPRKYQPYVAWTRREFRGRAVTINREGDRVHRARSDQPVAIVRFFGGSTVWAATRSIHPHARSIGVPSSPMCLSMLSKMARSTFARHSGPNCCRRRRRALPGLANDCPSFPIIGSCILIVDFPFLAGRRLTSGPHLAGLFFRRAIYVFDVAIKLSASVAARRLLAPAGPLGMTGPASI